MLRTRFPAENCGENKYFVKQSWPGCYNFLRESSCKNVHWALDKEEIRRAELTSLTKCIKGGNKKREKCFPVSSFSPVRAKVKNFPSPLFPPIIFFFCSSTREKRGMQKKEKEEKERKRRRKRNSKKRKRKETEKVKKEKVPFNFSV